MQSPLATIREVYSIWAPSTSIWSQWAKPVLFAEINMLTVRPMSRDELLATIQTDWLSEIDTQRTAIIVNFPDVQSVGMGIALAQKGYQPVPLYNAADGPSAIIPLNLLQAGVVAGAAILKDITFDNLTPPAFLVDSNRIQGAIPPLPGRFDNRWVVFPQDLPSGIFLRSRGIDQVLIVQPDAVRLQDDLRAVLGRWKKAGVTVLGKSIGTANEPPKDVTVGMAGIGGFGGWWLAAIALMGLASRRSNVGGFGSVIPTPNSSSG